jgi:hypothetical protein
VRCNLLLHLLKLRCFTTECSPVLRHQKSRPPSAPQRMHGLIDGSVCAAYSTQVATFLPDSRVACLPYQYPVVGAVARIDTHCVAVPVRNLRNDPCVAVIDIRNRLELACLVLRKVRRRCGLSCDAAHMHDTASHAAAQDTGYNARMHDAACRAATHA